MYSTIFNITAFGAVSGGKELCTEAFRLAVEACCEYGGGTVYVPAGTFLTGAIHLKSNITLNLDAGARLIFNSDVKDYPLVKSRWEGEDAMVYSPLIFGDNVENVAVTGRGILEGQGEFWWKLGFDKKLEHPRPRFICFQNSKNVLIDGISINNSPAWTVNPILCDNVTINNLTIKNPANSPNTDGINPDSCKNVHISNCHIDVGDDCITIKSGIESCSVFVPCENITITNCTMVNGHGAVVIGSEMSGGVKNVTVTNCVFQGTDRGLRLKSRRGRGGIVEDIRMNNIMMNGVMCPIVMHLFYYCGKTGKEKHVGDKNIYPIDSGTPTFRRIHFSNITARNVNAAASYIYGLPESPIEEITFDNISISMAENPELGTPAMMVGCDKMAGKGFMCNNAKDIRFSNVKISGQIGDEFDFENCENMLVNGKCR